MVLGLCVCVCVYPIWYFPLSEFLTPPTLRLVLLFCFFPSSSSSSSSSFRFVRRCCCVSNRLRIERGEESTCEEGNTHTTENKGAWQEVRVHTEELEWPEATHLRISENFNLAQEEREGRGAGWIMAWCVRIILRWTWRKSGEEAQLLSPPPAALFLFSFFFKKYSNLVKRWAFYKFLNWVSLSTFTFRRIKRSNSELQVTMN